MQQKLCLIFVWILHLTKCLVICVEIESDFNSSAPSQHFRLFVHCQQTAITEPEGLKQNQSYCKTEFDGIGCWSAALGDTTSTIACPDFIAGSNIENFAFRKCLSNGSWDLNSNGIDAGDYTPCHFNSNIQSVDTNRLYEIWLAMNSLEQSPYSDYHTAQAFEKCIDEVLYQPKPKWDFPYCQRTFDGWGCFNDTLAGLESYIPCPHFITGFSPERLAHKTCSESGEWFRHPANNKTWSNYTSCVDWDDFEFRNLINNIYITGYSISVVALLISLAIFFAFKSLSTQTRIRIHKNFFVSFIINNTMWIVWYLAIVKESNVLINNGIGCQLLHIFVHYFMVCNYFWMFCEGLYLHTLLVIAFVSENKILKWFYILGWGVPMPLTIVYAVLRSNSPNPKDTYLCWIEDGVYNWLLTGPVCMSLLLNLFFLINIVRVLVTKLRAVNTSDTHQTRKAVRATLILIPLLGLQFMLTPFRPETKTTAEKFYEIVSAIVTSLQGLCVALLFCFFNGEVLANLKKKWNQTLLSHGLIDRRQSYMATSVSTLGSESQDIPRESLSTTLSAEQMTLKQGKNN